MKSYKYKIGIVEDNMVIGNIVAWELSQDPNYQVKWFQTGEELLKEKEFKSDLIVLDYELDGKKQKAMNGLQVLEHLKKGKNIPVVIMSAQQEVQVAVNFIRNGVCDYIVKDENIMDHVRRSVGEVLEYREEKEELKTLSNQKKTDYYRLALLLSFGLLFFLTSMFYG